MWRSGTDWLNILEAGFPDWLEGAGAWHGRAFCYANIGRCEPDLYSKITALRTTSGAVSKTACILSIRT